MNTSTTTTKPASIIAGFVLLFALYHAAEYMIVFQQSASGFLAFQALFFTAAYFIGRWQFGNGLAAWGLGWSRKTLPQLLVGLLAGIALYALTLTISRKLNSEIVVSIPSFESIAGAFGLFVFGNFFSSFSEDVLTRGYLWKHFSGKISWQLLLLISPLVYVLNHIYRLGDGMQTYIYLFLLGVLLLIPLLFTKSLWMTGGIHWAGNCTFYLTHELWKTETVTGHISPNYILAFCLFDFSILLLLVFRKGLGWRPDAAQQKP
jgi:membrane protease YdiL (CAAX protease family)